MIEARRFMTLLLCSSLGIAACAQDGADEPVDVGVASQALNGCDETVPATRFIDGIPAYAQCPTTESGAIYSNNGIDTSITSMGSDWVRTQYSGGYQCTELAHRYLYFKWGVKWIPNGNAGEWCDTQPPANSGLVQSMTPTHGDLMVLAPGSCGADTTYGHVNVVDTIDAAKAKVTVVEQNGARRGSYMQTCGKCFLHVVANDGTNPGMSIAPPPAAGAAAVAGVGAPAPTQAAGAAAPTKRPAPAGSAAPPPPAAAPPVDTTPIPAAAPAPAGSAAPQPSAAPASSGSAGTGSTTTIPASSTPTPARDAASDAGCSVSNVRGEANSKALGAGVAFGALALARARRRRKRV